MTDYIAKVNALEIEIIIAIYDGNYDGALSFESELRDLRNEVNYEE